MIDGKTNKNDNEKEFLNENTCIFVLIFFCAPLTLSLAVHIHDSSPIIYRTVSYSFVYIIRFNVTTCYQEGLYVHYNSLIVKARHLVSRVRKSGPAVKKLVKSGGKTLVTENSTRWNSSLLSIC